MSVSRPTHATSGASASAAGANQRKRPDPPVNHWNPIWVVPNSLSRKPNRDRYRAALDERAPFHKRGNAAAESAKSAYISGQFPFRAAKAVADAIGKRADSRQVQALLSMNIPVVYTASLGRMTRHQNVSITVSGDRLTMEDVRNASLAKMEEIKQEEFRKFNDALDEYNSAEDEIEEEIEEEVGEILGDDVSAMEAQNETEELAEDITEANLESVESRIELIEGDGASDGIAIPGILAEDEPIPSSRDESAETPFRGIGESDNFKPRIQIEVPGKKDPIIYDFRDFILLSVNEIDAEKFQVVETFGEPKVYFFDRRARIYSYSIALRNDTINNWLDKWRQLYNEHLRGTQAVRNAARIIVQYEGATRIGYILQSSNALDSNMEKMASVSFTMFVESERNKSANITVEYPGMSDEDVKRLENEVAVSNCAVRAARIKAKIIIGTGPNDDSLPSLGALSLDGERSSERFFVRSVPVDGSEDECATDASKSLISRFTIDINLEESDDELISEFREDLESLVRECRVVQVNGQTRIAHGGRQSATIAQNEEGTPYRIELNPSARIPARLAFRMSDGQNLQIPFSVTFNGRPQSTEDPPVLNMSLSITGAAKGIRFISAPATETGIIRGSIQESHGGYLFSILMRQSQGLTEVKPDDPFGSIVGRIRFQVTSGDQAVEVDSLPEVDESKTQDPWAPFRNNRLVFSGIFFQKGPHDAATIAINKSSLSRSYIRFSKVDNSDTDLWAEYVIVGEMEADSDYWNVIADEVDMNSSQQTALTFHNIPLAFNSKILLDIERPSRLERVFTSSVMYFRRHFHQTLVLSGAIAITPKNPMSDSDARRIQLELDTINAATGSPSGSPVRIPIGGGSATLTPNLDISLDRIFNSSLKGVRTVTISTSLNTRRSVLTDENDILVNIEVRITVPTNMNAPVSSIRGLNFNVKASYLGEESVESDDIFRYYQS